LESRWEIDLNELADDGCGGGQGVIRIKRREADPQTKERGGEKFKSGVVGSTRRNKDCGSTWHSSPLGKMGFLEQTGFWIAIGRRNVCRRNISEMFTVFPNPNRLTESLSTNI